jgi:hypothetical protein
VVVYRIVYLQLEQNFERDFCAFGFRGEPMGAGTIKDRLRFKKMDLVRQCAVWCVCASSIQEQGGRGVLRVFSLSAEPLQIDTFSVKFYRPSNEKPTIW